MKLWKMHFKKAQKKLLLRRKQTQSTPPASANLDPHCLGGLRRKKVRGVYKTCAASRTSCLRGGALTRILTKMVHQRNISPPNYNPYIPYTYLNPTSCDYRSGNPRVLCASGHCFRREANLEAKPFVFSFRSCPDLTRGGSARWHARGLAQPA